MPPTIINKTIVMNLILHSKQNYIVLNYFYIYLFQIKKKINLLRMNTISCRQNMHKTFYCSPYPEYSSQLKLIRAISNALSVSINEYSKNKVAQNKNSHSSNCIIIDLQSDKEICEKFDQNGGISEKNVDQSKILNQISIKEDLSIEKSQKVLESRCKSTEEDFFASNKGKSEATVTKSPKNQSIQACGQINLDIIECRVQWLPHRKIIQKKESLLRRKIQVKQGKNRKTKYHGVGPRKRELRMLG